MASPLLAVFDQFVADGVYYRAYSPASSRIKADDTESLLRSYFSLDVSLRELYAHWSNADSHFKNTALRFAGVRLLRQDPWECLIGFICSSNNNIARITQMVCTLRKNTNSRWRNYVSITVKNWER
jgi:3-methyladenine DNA glycosylase/8-oxoguanine DNA glycosylase